MNDYWEKRSTDLEILLQRRTDETVKEVNKRYVDAINSIKERVKAVFDRYAQGNSLAESQALMLLNSKQTEEYRQELLEKLQQTTDAKARKEIISVLDAPAYANRISRLEALANEIYIEAYMLGAVLDEQLTKRLVDIYEYSYYKRTFDIQQFTGEYYDFEKLSSRRLKEALSQKWEGKNYSQRVWDNTEETARRLKDIVIKGIMTGQSLKTMTDAMTTTIGNDSDSGARFKASRLIRTEVNYISGQATQKAYTEAGFEEYVYLATLDKKTCRNCGHGDRKSCAELDGKKFKVKDAKIGVNKHPMHPFCRCTDYPYIPNSRKGTRAARDENGRSITVPDDMTYQEWYEKYGKNSVYTNYPSSNDKSQFERYSCVLKELCPKTIDEFVEIKYNKKAEWEKLKKQYRVVNQYKVDSGNVSAQEVLSLDRKLIDEKRKNLPSKYKKSGNIAGAYIDTNEKMFIAHSRINSEMDAGFNNYKGTSHIALLKEKRNFKYIDVDMPDGTVRKDTYFDTEAKLFEEIHLLSQQKTVKKITMISERGMCDSCKGVMEQFKLAHPDIKVNVVSNKKVNSNVWKYRREKIHEQS